MVLRGEHTFLSFLQFFLSKCLFSSLLGTGGQVGIGSPKGEHLPPGSVFCGPLVATEGNVMKLACIFWAV